ncbi:hypothetical protein KKB40_06075, partial [Patescibacteria group bacterium]|nr:hypothetical protein [Patescibacteria group bacterium]
MSAERNYSEPDDEMIKRSRNWKGGSNPLPTRSGEHGCPLGCIYCNQISLDRNTSGEKVAGYLFQGVDSVISLNTRIMSGSQVVMEISTDDILSELSKYPHFNPKSPFLIENFNDPGLNWGQSIEVAKRLVTELGHSGPSIFITKMPISQRRIEEMKRLQKIGGKPIVIVTYSGHPKEIEPASGPKRIEAIKKLHGNNIPTVLSMRPMIEGINITDENIRRVANEAGVYASVITVGGLFVYQPETIEVFEKAGYHLSDLYRNNKYPPAKVLPKNVKGTVRQIMREEGVGANVHDHTSCAVAEISTVVYGDPTPDRLAHWAGDVKPNFDYCQSKCHPKQLVICKRTSERKVNEVIKDAQEALIKIGYQHEIVPSLTQAGMLLVKGG